MKTAELPSTSWLRQKFDEKRRKNPAYSLRGFARQLNISHGLLSDIFASKKQLTAQTTRKIASRLLLSPTEEEKLLTKIKWERDNIRQMKKAAKESDRQSYSTYQPLDADAFSLIADWYYYGILYLIDTMNFKNDPKWIANRLGISIFEVRTALDRLNRLGMIREENGELIKTEKNITTTNDIQSRALQISHRQNLEQAINVLETVDVKDRDFSSVTFAFDPSQIKEVKELIRVFRRKMEALFSQGKKTEVYNLNIQFVPVTKLSEELSS